MSDSNTLKAQIEATKEIYKSYIACKSRWGLSKIILRDYIQEYVDLKEKEIKDRYKRKLERLGLRPK